MCILNEKRCKKNKDKIKKWDGLSRNHNIFTYDYKVLRESNKELKHDLIKAAWKPHRVSAWLDAGIDLDDM